jgi:hypothetical protein
MNQVKEKCLHYKLILVVPPSHSNSKIKKLLQPYADEDEQIYPILMKYSKHMNYKGQNIILTILKIHSNTKKSYLKKEGLWQDVCGIIYPYEIHQNVTKKEVLKFNASLDSISLEKKLFRYVICETNFKETEEETINNEAKSWKRKHNFVFINSIRREGKSDILGEIVEHIYNNYSKLNSPALLNMDWKWYWLIFLVFLYVLYESSKHLISLDSSFEK